MSAWSWFGKVHGAIYRATGGRLGAKLGWLPMLLLTTTGRRTGHEHRVPLAYMLDGESFVIVASNGGADVPPAWWLNLQATRRARIQVRGRHLTVEAALASPEERARLWPELKKINPPYATYERRTRREIPVVLLRATTDGAKLPAG